MKCDCVEVAIVPTEQPNLTLEINITYAPNKSVLKTFPHLCFITLKYIFDQEKFRRNKSHN